MRSCGTMPKTAFFCPRAPHPDGWFPVAPFLLADPQKICRWLASHVHSKVPIKTRVNVAASTLVSTTPAFELDETVKVFAVWRITKQYSFSLGILFCEGPF